jgi:hypothetical protein
MTTTARFFGSAAFVLGCIGGIGLSQRADASATSITGEGSTSLTGTTYATARIAQFDETNAYDTLGNLRGANVIVENGNARDGVFFQLGRSAMFGSGTLFEGNILALESISLDRQSAGLRKLPTAENFRRGGINDPWSVGYSGGDFVKAGHKGGFIGVPSRGVQAPEIDPASAATGLTLLLGSLLVLRGRLRMQPGRSSLA